MRLSHSTVPPCSRRRVSEPGPLPCGDNGVLIGRTLQRAFAQRAIASRICPAHPRSLARCFSRAQRHLAFCFALRRPAGFGFQKIFVATNAKRFSEPSEKTHLRHLGAGHTRIASRKSDPRAIRANSNRSKSMSLYTNEIKRRVISAKTPITSQPNSSGPSRFCRSPPSPATRTSGPTSGSTTPNGTASSPSARPPSTPRT